MIKQVILIVLLSVAAIFFKGQLDYVLHLLLLLHDRVLSFMATIFSDDKTGQLVQSVLVLVFVPVVSVTAVAGSYWAVKRSAMPYATQAVWAVWFVLLTAIALQGV